VTIYFRISGEKSLAEWEEEDERENGGKGRIRGEPKSTGRSACATLVDLRIGHEITQEEPKMPA